MRKFIPARIVPRMALLGLAVWVASCSEQTPVEERPIQAHPPEWSDPTKPDWHGTRVAMQGPGTCTSCHGEDLQGDLVVPGCYDCHDGPSGHPEGWAMQPEPFHGDRVALEGPMVCASCHGEVDVPPPANDGGWSGVTCYDCHYGPGGHNVSWMNPNSSSFHGRVVIQQGDDDCRRCHGADLLGGTSGVSCNDCHPYPF